MKSISIFLTLALVAGSGVPALGETPRAPAEQNVAPSQTPRQALDAERLLNLSTKMWSAQMFGGIDDMRPVLEEIMPDDSIPAQVKEQFLEPFYLAQIRALVAEGNDDNFKAFCDDFIAQATETPAYFVAAELCVELLSFERPELSAELRERVIDAIKTSEEPRIGEVRGVADALATERAPAERPGSDLFSKALRGGKEARETFLAAYSKQLAGTSSSALGVAAKLVSQALDENQTELAEDVARVVEESQKGKPKDYRRRAALADVRRELNRRPLETLIGQELNFVGLDVKLNEATLEPYRGKYVVVAFVPNRVPISRKENAPLDEFDEFVKTLYKSKVASVAYVESVGLNFNTSLGASPKVDSTFAFLRGKPYQVVPQDLAIRSNVSRETNYPALFQKYRVPKTQFALVDPNGVLLSVDSSTSRLKRRLQLLIKVAFQPQNLILPQDVEDKEP